MKEVKSGIYMIQNMLNGKVYIGSSVDMKTRWRKHILDLSAGKHHSIKLQNSWNKYGDVFIFSVLTWVEDKESLQEREQFWLDFFNSSVLGYNILSKAHKSSWGTHSEEARRRMSESGKGRVCTQETRDKISKAKMGHVGVVHTEETKKLIGEHSKGNQHSKGKKHSEDANKKKSEAMKGNTRAKGRVQTEDEKKKRSESMMGLKRAPRTKEHTAKIVESRRLNALRRLEEDSCANN